MGRDGETGSKNRVFNIKWNKQDPVGVVESLYWNVENKKWRKVKMKRKTSIFVAVLLVLTIIVAAVGCSDQMATDTQSQAPAAPSQETSAAVSETAPASAAVSEEAPATVIQPKNGKNFVIGFSLPETGSTVMQALAAGVESECEANGYDVVTAVSETTSEKQINDIEAFITSNVDLVIMLPNDSKTLAPAVKALNKANIPLVCVLREVFDEQYLSTVKMDSETLGTLAGEYIAKKLNGAGNVVEIFGAPGVSNSIIIQEAFKKVLDQHPDIKIVASQPGLYDRTKAQDAMEAIIQSGVQFDAVFAQNGDMTSGTFLAMQAAKIDTSKIVFVGGNFLKEAADRIAAGTQAADITTPMNPMGMMAVDTAAKYFAGEKVESVYYVPVELVDKENLSKFTGQ
jgi:ABC-type sugar transport system substrate-binding protein